MWSEVQVDVSQVYNSTTLGLYSFRVFVDAIWSLAKVTNIPMGRRPLEIIGKSHRKRPLADDIKKTAVRISKKPKVNMLVGKENSVPPEIEIRKLRNGKVRK